MVKDDEKENKASKERFIEGAVTTQTSPVVVDTSKKEDDEARVLSTEAALAKILSKLEGIEKALLN